MNGAERAKTAKGKPMTISDFQIAAMETAIYPQEEMVIYPTLGLCGEAGELANKIKKVLRDDNSVITAKKKEAVAREIGDCLWYLAALAFDLGLNLEDIAKDNIIKLRSRKRKSTLPGDGDER